MTKKITAEEVKQKLRSIVNERGYEYKYESPLYEDDYGELVKAEDCYYSDSEGNPSCIVGVLLHDVAPDTFRSLHEFEWHDFEWHDFEYFPHCASVDELYTDGDRVSKVKGVELSDIFEPEALKVLSVVQREQDMGTSWGEAVDLVVELY